MAVNCGRPTTAFLWLLFLCSLAEQTTAQTIEAHEVGTGNGVIDIWGASWGSFDRDYLQTKRLRITVRDVTRKLREVELLVYFIGRRLPSGEQFIYSHNRIPVVLNGDIEVTGDIPAPQIKLNQYHSGRTGRNHFSGKEIRGWIIVGRDGSRIFDTRASGPDLLERAREDSQLPDSLRAMIAAAHIHDEPLKSTVPSQTRPAALSSEPPSTPEAPLVPAMTQPQPAAEFITLTKPVEVQIMYGKTTLPVGTRLKVVSHTNDAVNAYYMDETVTIPAGSAAAEQERQLAAAFAAVPTPTSIPFVTRPVAISAPRPYYSYEARSRHITGAGIALFTIEPSSGWVTDVSMAQSTGSPILDNATVSAFRRWRFKPGSYEPHFKLPISYTMTGATY